MNSAYVMLTREFYRLALPQALNSVVLIVICVGVNAYFGFGDSPSAWFLAGCGTCISFMLCRSAMPKPYHLHLPVSARRLATVFLVNALLLGMLTISLALGAVCLLFLKDWQVISLSILMTSLVVLGISVAKLTCEREVEVWTVGLMFAVICGISISGFATSQHVAVLLLLSLVTLVISWQCLVTAVKRERRLAPTLGWYFRHWNDSLSKWRRDYDARFDDAGKAVFQLDWMRLRVAVIGGSIALSVGFGLVPLAVDPTIVCLPFVSLGVVAMAVMSTGSFIETETTSNGEFRWNLPVSDAAIVRGLRKDVLVTVSAVVLSCYLSLLIVLAYLQLAGHLPFARSQGRIPLNFTNILLLSTASIPIQIAIGWVSGMRGLETSLNGRGATCRQLILFMLWIGGWLVALFYISESNQAFSFELLMAWAGIALSHRTITAFRWAREMAVVPQATARTSIIAWLISSAMLITTGLCFGFVQIGGYILAVGLLGSVVQPIAALPIVVFLRRHHC